MSANTPNRSYTYPQSTDDPDVPADMQELANDIDGDVQTIVDRVSALEASQPRTFVKPSGTGRTSTTTYSADPHLSGIALAAGTYEVEVVIHWVQLTTNTQKLKTKWGFTGTWNGAAAIRACVGGGSAQTASPNVATEVNVGAPSLTGDAVYSTALGTAYAMSREICANVVVTVAGDLSLDWAQSASSGNSTNVQEGSFIRVRKIS